jgi:hypothetical protein
MGQTAELGQSCVTSSVWGLAPLNLCHGLRRNEWLSPAENAHRTGDWVTPQPGGGRIGACWESNPELKPILMTVLAAAQRNYKIGALPALE